MLNDETTQRGSEIIKSECLSYQIQKNVEEKLQEIQGSV
jgi:hypothetical protein